MLGLNWCVGFYLAAVSLRYSAGAWVLTVALSLVAEHRLRAFWLQQLQHTGSAAVVHGLSCFVACRILPAQGLNQSLLRWQAGSLPLSHQEALLYLFFFLNYRTLIRCFDSLLFYFFICPLGMQNPSSPNRNQNHTPSITSMESQPLDGQGSPTVLLLCFDYIYMIGF